MRKERKKQNRKKQQKTKGIHMSTQMNESRLSIFVICWTWSVHTNECGANQFQKLCLSSELADLQARQALTSMRSLTFITLFCILEPLAREWLSACFSHNQKWFSLNVNNADEEQHDQKLLFKFYRSPFFLFESKLSQYTRHNN